MMMIIFNSFVSQELMELVNMELRYEKSGFSVEVFDFYLSQWRMLLN